MRFEQNRTEQNRTEQNRTLMYHSRLRLFSASWSHTRFTFSSTSTHRRHASEERQGQGCQGQAAGAFHHITLVLDSHIVHLPRCVGFLASRVFVFLNVCVWSLNGLSETVMSSPVGREKPHTPQPHRRRGAVRPTHVLSPSQSSCVMLLESQSSLAVL